MTDAPLHTASPRRRPVRDTRRLLVVAVVTLAPLLIVAGRLVQLQIVEADAYAELARRQYESKVILQSERGLLYDRNGHLLASNSVGVSFAVDPRIVEHPEQVAATFSRVFGGEPGEWVRRVTTPNTSFVWLRRKVSGPPLEQLKDLNDNGLIRVREPLRHFEFATVGAQIIGGTNIDNQGLSGVELYYNQQLSGSAGYIIMQRDARGRRRPDVDLPQRPPEHGDALMLTIDINTQTIVEEELRRGVERTGAANGTAIAIDPRSGELLAVASWPTFDPNQIAQASADAIRVRAITDTYEPGSTMKAVTAAAALEEDVASVDDVFDAEGGEWKVGAHVIRDDHAASTLTFGQGVEMSSNIVMAKVASRIPTPRFYKYVRDFGFGIVSGVDLPGEVRGEVKKPSDFGPDTREFMAFGYQLAVTPLQLLVAYATIANDGVMMRPHILKRRMDREGNMVEEVEAQEIRRVVSPETARTVRDLLVGVVERGTGREARIPGLSIAGKTGTAQKLDGGAYSRSKYNSSFIGFFPAEQPAVALLVLLDSPTNGYYGGQVAAPIFREIARRIVGVAAPSEQAAASVHVADVSSTVHPAGTPALRVPDVRGIDPEGARRLVEHYGLRPLLQGDGGAVVSQIPPPGELANPRGVVTLVTQTKPTVVPDLRGLSLRRALALLTTVRLSPEIQGTGVVQQQHPSPGSPLPPSREVRLVLRDRKVE